MKIRHQELEINEEDPFSNCRLGRKNSAEVLTSVVSTYADGFVLAINNKWGTGKTTFVRMWEQHLKNDGFTTVYFNAWENDFDPDPMVAILAELESIRNKSNQAAFKSALKKGAVLSKNIAPGLLKALIKPYFDAQAVLDVLESATKAGTEILEAQILDYAKKKASIADFRVELERFISASSTVKPIIFIIDELDRCRPNYAVEVLEHLKHFFSVKGIVFALSIDKGHLAASVRGFYGSEQINTDEYLRRFVDLEYSLPDPSAEQFCNYLYQYFGFDEVFESLDNEMPGSDGHNFLRIARLLFHSSGSTLRQMEKILGQSRLIIGSFKGVQRSFSDVLLVLVYLSVRMPHTYSDLKKRKLSTQELSDTFVSLVSEHDVPDQTLLQYDEAILLTMYTHYLGPKRDVKLLNESSEGPTTPIVSKLNDSAMGRTLAKALLNVFNNRDFSQLNLATLIRRVDLTEDLMFQ